MLLNLLYYCDFFKSPITFWSSGNDKFSTIPGAILSIMIFIFLLYGFFTSNMVLRSNPLINIQSILGVPYSNLNLKKSNFAIVTALQTINGTNLIEPSIFNFVAIQKSLNTTTGDAIEYKEQYMRLCELKDFPDNDTLNIPYVNAFCFDYDNLEIEGFWTTEILKYLQVEIRRCVNGTNSGVVCKSNEEISEYFMNNHGFNFYFIDKTFNMDDLKNPIKTIVTNKYTVVNQLMYKYVDYFIKKVIFIDDQDFLFETNVRQDSHIYDHAEVEVNIRSDYSDPSLGAANFFSDRNTQHMIRRYEKISEVLAKLGGIGGSLISLGIIVLGIYQKYLFILNLANNNYKFQKLEERVSEKKSNDQIQVHIDPLSSNKEIKFFDPLSTNKEIRDTQNEVVFTHFDIADKSPQSREMVAYTKQLEDVKPNIINLVRIKNTNNSIDDEVTQKHFKLQPKTLSLEEIRSELKSNFPEEKEKEAIRDRKCYSIERKPSILQRTSKFLHFFSLKSTGKSLQTPSLMQKFRDMNHKEKKEYELKFSFFNYLSYLLKGFFNVKLSKKEKLFLQAEKNIEKDMDLYKIMKKLKEINRIKVVLLGEKKIKLFNLLGGEMVYADRNDLKAEDKKKGFYKVSETLMKIRDEKELMEVVQYYEFLKSKKSITEEEKRLIDLIEDKINLIEDKMNDIKNYKK